MKIIFSDEEIRGLIAKELQSRGFYVSDEGKRMMTILADDDRGYPVNIIAEYRTEEEVDGL